VSASSFFQSTAGQGFFGGQQAPELDTQNVKAAIGQEDESVFGNVTSFLSRPLWVVNELLSGDFEGAGRNALQFGIDLATGGFITDTFHPGRALNLFLPEEYEVPLDLARTKEYRPEFSDVLRTWGMGKSRGAEKFGLDLVGGILLDPLTYLSLGTTGLAKGLAGASRHVATESLVSAMKGTVKGKSKLADGAASFLRANPYKRGVEAVGVGQEQLASRILDRARKPLRNIDEAVRADADQWVKDFSRFPEVDLDAGRAAREAMTRESAEKVYRTDLDKLARLEAAHGTLENWATKEAAKRLVKINRGVEQRAAEVLYWKTAGQNTLEEAETLARTATDALNPTIRGQEGVRLPLHKAARGPAEDLLDDGIRALKTEGLMNAGGLDLWIPFRGEKTRLVDGLSLGDIGRVATMPGWLRMAAKKISPDAVRGADEFAITAWNNLKGNFWDPTFKGLNSKIQPAVQQVLRKLGQEYAGDTIRAQKEVGLSWAKVAEADQIAVGKAVAAAETEWLGVLENSKTSLWRKVADSGLEAQVADLTKREADLDAIFKASKSPADKAARTANRSELRAAKKRLDGQGVQGVWALTKHGKHTFGQIRDEIMTKVGGLPGVTPEAIDKYLFDMGEINKELARHKIFRVDKGNPFYFPHQASELMADLAEHAEFNLPLSRAMKEIVKARRRGTNEQFVESLQKTAKTYGIPYEATAEVAEYRIGQLHLERRVAHARTLGRVKANEHALSLGMTREAGKPQGPLATYLKAQFEGIPEKTNTIGKILGGGTFRLPVTAAQTLKTLGFNAENWKVVKDAEGSKHLEWNYPGVNVVFKPALTSHPSNPNYHSRNWSGAVIMGGLHPQIGYMGGKALAQSAALTGKTLFGSMLGAMKHGPWVSSLEKRGYTGGEIADVMLALKSSEARTTAAKAARDAAADPGNATRAELMATSQSYALEAEQAMLRLEEGGKLGPGGRTWREVFTIYENAGLGMNRHSEADLMAEVAKLTDHSSWRALFAGDAWKEANAGAKARLAWSQYVKVGERMGNFTEDLHRFQAINRALDKGLSPTDAIDAVSKAFVNYNVNSAQERFLRDVVPFAKFSIGAMAWTGQLARRPGETGMTLMARTRAAAEGAVGESGGFLPEQAEDTIALPLPWKDLEGNQQFLIGLGLPQETVIQMLELGTLQGARRRGLGSMHPLVKLPFEAVTDRNMFFGGEFGTYRKAPLGLGTSEVTMPDGSVRQEVPGGLNEVLRALPTSRAQSSIQKLIDGRRTGFNKVFNALTGARTMSVDQEKELRLKLHDYLKIKVRRGEVGEISAFFARMDPADVPEDLKAVLSTMRSLRSKKRREKKRSEGLGLLGQARAMRGF